MTEKAKNGSRSLLARLRWGLAHVALGLVLIALGGGAVGAAISVSQRYAAPEDALLQYPRQYEPHWIEAADSYPSQISDFTVIQRTVLPDLNAIHFVFTWQDERGGRLMECAGGSLVGEFQDIFGGWYEMRGLEGGCSSPPGPGGGMASYDFWQSAPWEGPPRYFFAYRGTTPSEGEGAIEFALGDGSRERVEPAGSGAGRVIYRAAPFQIETESYFGADGELYFSHDFHH